MNKVLIHGQHNASTILIGERLTRVMDYIPAHQPVFILSDENVARLYGPLFPGYPVYEIAAGEASKSLEVVAGIYRWLLQHEADRSAFILAIGGGVVCDLAGFIAATFMRGVRSGFVASSLLAQVDASVGGKNGVNLDRYKNIVGTFNQPDFVICDTTLLASLSEEEYCNGLAEVVKHALIADAEKFVFLEQQAALVKARNLDALQYLVKRSVEIKAGIVEADEREGGVRRLLNLGHTWGHALEKVYGIPHGQAVSLGMVVAAKLAIRLGLLPDTGMKRLVNVLQLYGLPVSMPVDKEKVFEAMLRDKKKEKSGIHYILPVALGNAIVREIPVEELRTLIFEIPD